MWNAVQVDRSGGKRQPYQNAWGVVYQKKQWSFNTRSQNQNKNNCAGCKYKIVYSTLIYRKTISPHTTRTASSINAGWFG
jgi:hypothetical protein